MADNDEITYTLADFSLGAQGKTTVFLTKKNQLLDSTNADYSKKIGALSKNKGRQKQGDDLTSTTTTSTSSSTTTTSTSTSTSTSSSTTTTSTSTTTTP